MNNNRQILPKLSVGVGALLLGPLILYAQPGSGQTTNEILAASAARVSIANAREAEAKARTQESLAEITAAQARFGPLGNFTTSGNVIAGNGAGGLEVELLAADAIREAADRLGARLCRLIASQERREPRELHQDGEPGATADCQPLDVSPVPAPERNHLPYELYGYDACTGLDYQETYQDTRRDPGQGSGEQPGHWRSLVFVTKTDFQNFDAYESLMVRLTAAGRAMCQAIYLAREATLRTDSWRHLRLKNPEDQRVAAANGGTPDVRSGTFDIGVETAAVALNTVASLLRTEYNIQSVTITSDADRTFARETMLAVLRRRPGTPIFAPSLFPMSSHIANNPLVRKFNLLDDIRRAALAEANSQAEAAQVFDAMRTTVTDVNVAKVTTAAALHGERRTSLVNAVAAYATLIDTASNPPAAGGVALLPTALRQARSVQLLRQDGILVLTEVNRAGGSTLTRRNFFTAFGRMPFYVSGGVLVSFSVMDGSTGQMLDSGAIPVAGGYEQIEDAQDRFRPASDRRARRRR